MAMRTDVRQTSLVSYMDLKEHGVLGERQRQVFRTISLHPDGICDWEIAQETGLPINCVTGRRNELITMGMVKQKGIKYNEKTNRYVTTWYLVC